MRRAWPFVVSGVMIAAVLWPLGWPAGTDGFPLSRYPMFVMPRPKSEVFLYVVARDPGGGTTKVDSRAWTPGGPNLGASILRTTQAESPAEMDALCARIARHLAGQSPAPSAGTTIEIRSGMFSHKRFASTGRASPAGSKQLAACAVLSP
jgi:hypothetical protein